MKKIVFALLLTAFGLQAKSQNTGYLGKHVILKTDAINGIRPGFNNIDLEIVVSRELAITGSARNLSFSTLSYSNKKDDKRVETSSDFYDQYYKYLSIIPGNTTGQMVSIGAKYYLNKILPAPLGFYVASSIGYGSGESYFNALTVYKPVYSKPGPVKPADTNYEIREKFQFYNITLPAVGYQTVLFKRLTLDGQVSVETYADDLSEEFANEYLQKDLYSIYTKNSYKYSLLRSNLISTSRKGAVTFGLSIYGKVGLLLF